MCTHARFDRKELQAFVCARLSAQLTPSVDGDTFHCAPSYCVIATLTKLRQVVEPANLSTRRGDLARRVILQAGWFKPLWLCAAVARKRTWPCGAAITRKERG